MYILTKLILLFLNFVICSSLLKCWFTTEVTGSVPHFFCSGVVCYLLIIMAYLIHIISSRTVLTVGE